MSEATRLEELVQRRGLPGVKESVDVTARKLACGNLKRVTLDDIKSALILTEARI